MTLGDAVRRRIHDSGIRLVEGYGFRVQGFEFGGFRVRVRVQVAVILPDQCAAQLLRTLFRFEGLRS